MIISWYDVGYRQRYHSIYCWLLLLLYHGIQWVIERGFSRTFYPVEVPFYMANGLLYQGIKCGIERGSSRRTFYLVEVPFNIRLVGDYIKV